MSISEKYIDMDGISFDTQRTLFGQLDSYIKIIERALNVTFINRNGNFKIVGASRAIERAESVVLSLASLLEKNNEITEQNVTYAIAMVCEDDEEELEKLDSELIFSTYLRCPLVLGFMGLP